MFTIPTAVKPFAAGTLQWKYVHANGIVSFSIYHISEKDFSDVRDVGGEVCI